MSLLRWVSSHALGALAEPGCAACEAPIPIETVFCVPCAGTLVPHDGSPPRFGAPVEVAAFAYGGALRDAIGRFKYGRRDDLARPLGSLFLRTRPRVMALRPNVVVPVPSHPVRLALRTFEPSALLGRVLAHSLGAALVLDALDKVRSTPAQAGLDRRARFGNLKGAFACAPSRVDVLRGARVVLADDVRTTGATLAACTEALRSCGAEVVGHVVLAAAMD